MLQQVELRMESLTQEQEQLSPEKVELARLSCEKERRAREREARLENQRQMEARRNKAALDRALAPPYRPEGRRPMFRWVRANRKPDLIACRTLPVGLDSDPT
jgi:hypothetical protein